MADVNWSFSIKFRGYSGGLCFYLLLAGSTIFSGGLYILVFSDLKFLGAIIPVGGVLMIAGWCFLAWTGKNLCQVVCSGSH